MKTFCAFSFTALVGALTALNPATASAASVLYGSTAAGNPGELYILNPLNGSVIQDVGALHDSLNVNYDITGLAFNPVSGVLYGSTGNSDPATAAKLVSINPLTALVTVIGSFNAGNVGKPATMADLAFTPAGSLFGVGSVGGPQLYSINLSSGQATVVGGTGLTSTSGGGLEISSGGVYYGTPTSTRFGTYNSTTGAFSNIAAPTRPDGGAYAALSINDTGTLFGLNLGSDSSITDLVTIDPTTGAVTDLGRSAGFLDAIAFQIIPEPGTVALALTGGAALVVSAIRRRK